MSAQPLPADHQGDRAWSAWPLSRTFWGGLTLVAMWLAVLFVGIFGGNIESASASGSASSVPVVVALAVIALLATIAVVRWAFRPPPAVEDLRQAIEDDERAIAQLTARLDQLQSRPESER